MHTGEDVAIVGDGGQHQPVIPEGILHALGQILPGQIRQHHLLSPGFQFPAQFLGSGLGMAIDGGVSDEDAGILRTIGGPNIIFFNVMAQVFLENGAMEGADGRNIQRGRSFQQLLHLHTVLTHDADVIPPGLAIPILLHIQCAEFAEAVRREEYLVAAIVADHHLGPVDHRGEDKGQAVLAQGQGSAVLHRQLLHLGGIGEELGHHQKGLGIAHHGCLGIALQEFHNIGRMVRLHVLHHQIIQLPGPQHSGNVFQPLLPEVLIHGVHHGYLLIQNHIGIVRHAIGHHILSLEQIHLMVVHADIANIIGNHLYEPP